MLILVWFLGIVVWIVMSFMFGGLIFWIGLGTVIIFTLFLVYFELAPKNLFFTFIEEGTAKIIVKGGEFQKILISWKDHIIDKDTWDVKEKKGVEAGFFGGLRFYGIPPIQQIFSYKQRWVHLHENGDIKEHEEDLNYVLLKTDFYVFDLPLTEKESAQDINGMSLGVKVVIPMRIVNPYEALFGPRRWLAAISGTVKPVVKRFVARYRYKEDLLDMKAGKGIEEIQIENGITRIETDKSTGESKSVSEGKEGDDLRDKLWEGLKEIFPEGEVLGAGGEEFLRIYGVMLRKKGTDILKIETSPHYREMVTKEYEADQEAKMTVITGEAEGRAMTRRTTLPVWHIAKQLAGITKKDEDLSTKERKKISVYLEEAWSNYLETKSIEAIKPTDKIIVTEGKGVGQTVGRDVAREMFRKEISKKRKGEEKE
jgi:hypothetical protein